MTHNDIYWYGIDEASFDTMLEIADRRRKARDGTIDPAELALMRSEQKERAAAVLASSPLREEADVP